MFALSWWKCSCPSSNYFSKFLYTPSSHILMWIYFRWPLYQCSLSVALYFIFHWKYILFSTLSDDWCALAPFSVFSLFQFPWHTFYSCNSTIYLLYTKIIFLLRFMQKKKCLFKFLSTVAASFFIRAIFVLSSIRIFCN